MISKFHRPLLAKNRHLYEQTEKLEKTRQTRSIPERIAFHV